jgi:RNA polymerase sigma-70 factor (ECF subfamily)
VVNSSTDIGILLSDCLTGDQHAIEILVHTYEAGVFNLALSVVDDPAEAADITQETFVRALKSLQTYREQSVFKSWLFKIALNLCRDFLRRRKRIQGLTNSFARGAAGQPEASRPEDSAIQNETNRTILSALSALDDHHRIPLVLRYYHDLPVSEIASLLGLNEGTVHSRLHYGRERLRAVLRRMDGE